MPDPTLSDIEAMGGAVARLFEDLRLAGNVTSGHNVTDDIKAILATLKGDYTTPGQAAIDTVRAQYGFVYSSGSACFNFVLRSFGKLIAEPSPDPASIWPALLKYYVDNLKFVKSRSMTFNAATPGVGNVGTGELIRLNKDRYNIDIESQFTEAYTAKCTADRNTGAYVGEEVFRVKAPTGAVDVLGMENLSGLSVDLPTFSVRSAALYLTNPGFRTYGGTAAAPSSFDGWTSSVTVNSTNYVVDTVNYYRTFQGDSTPSSLTMKVTAILSQALSVRGTKLSRDIPYVLEVAYNAEVGTAVGDLKIEIGSKSATVAVGGKVGWNKLRVALSTNCWPDNFDDGSDLTIKLTWTKTSGTLLIGDVALMPMVQLAFGWYLLIGGKTAFAANDAFSWSNSAAATSIMQGFFRRYYGTYLPGSTGVGITWADPT